MKQSSVKPSALLHALLDADGPMRVETLARSLNVDETSIRRMLDELAQADCRLHTQPDRGVQLIEAGLGAWADYMQWRRPTQSAVVYRSTASTQDLMRAMIEQQGRNAHGATAIADEQTVGRGRLGRRWYAPPGAALLFSRAYVKPLSADAAAAERTDHFMFIAAMKIARAIESVCGGDLCVAIKWPNDLLIDGKKLAGVLVESFTCTVGAESITACILGVGINVRVDPQQFAEPIRAELTQRLTSLAMCGRAIDRLRLLDAVLEQLDAKHDDDELLADWRRRCVQLSHEAAFVCDGWRVQGRVIDLDPHEGLIVRTNAGAVVHLPAATTSVV